jgi:hypothetical protein
MTTTETPATSEARLVLSRWLSIAVCALTGFRIGLDLLLLTGLTGVRANPFDAALQVCAMALVASMVLRGVRGWLGLAVACLVYAIVAALVELPAHPSPWIGLLLAHHVVLLVTVLALWLVGIERPPPYRLRLAITLGAGAVAGAAACVGFAGVIAG